MYTSVKPDTVYSFERFAMDCHSCLVCMQCRMGCGMRVFFQHMHCDMTLFHCTINIKNIFLQRTFRSSSPQWVQLCWTDCCDRMWKNLARYRSLWITCFLLCVFAWVVCSLSARPLKQMSFYSKMALSLFIISFLCCRHSPFPNNEHTNFRHEVLIVGVLSVHLLCVS